MCCDNAKAPLNIYGSVIVILSGLISRICSRVVGLFNKSALCRNPNRVAAGVQALYKLGTGSVSWPRRAVHRCTLGRGLYISWCLQLGRGGQCMRPPV